MRIRWALSVWSGLFMLHAIIFLWKDLWPASHSSVASVLSSPTFWLVRFVFECVAWAVCFLIEDDRASVAAASEDYVSPLVHELLDVAGIPITAVGSCVATIVRTSTGYLVTAGHSSSGESLSTEPPSPHTSQVHTPLLCSFHPLLPLISGETVSDSSFSE